MFVDSPSTLKPFVRYCPWAGAQGCAGPEYCRALISDAVILLSRFSDAATLAQAALLPHADLSVVWRPSQMHLTMRRLSRTMGSLDGQVTYSSPWNFKQMDLFSLPVLLYGAGRLSLRRARIQSLAFGLRIIQSLMGLNVPLGASPSGCGTTHLFCTLIIIYRCLIMNGVHWVRLWCFKISLLKIGSERALTFPQKAPVKFWLGSSNRGLSIFYLQTSLPGNDDQTTSSSWDAQLK